MSIIRPVPVCPAGNGSVFCLLSVLWETRVRSIKLHISNLFPPPFENNMALVRKEVLLPPEPRHPLMPPCHVAVRLHRSSSQEWGPWLTMKTDWLSEWHVWVVSRTAVIDVSVANQQAHLVQTSVFIYQSIRPQWKTGLLQVELCVKLLRRSEINRLTVEGWCSTVWQRSVTLRVSFESRPVSWL